MLTEEQIYKLNAYFGFANKKRCLFVGIKLEEALVKNKISLLLITKSCEIKNEEKFRNLSTNKNMLVLTYKGEYDVSLASGYEKLNAVGVGDRGLAKAIYSILHEDK